MKKSDLYREWARVLDMCEGTNVCPNNCWKFCVMLMDDVPALDDHPDYYSFAVAILEDKPVFVGDKVWYTFMNRFIEIKTAIQIELLIRDGQASWQPPKKTFALNGEELPCPELEPNYNFCAKLDIYGGDGHSFTCRFGSHGERNKVADAIIKLLKDATK